MQSSKSFQTEKPEEEEEEKDPGQRSPEIVSFPS